MNKKISYTIWTIGGLLVLSLLVFATTINENSVSSTNGSFSNLSVNYIEGNGSLNLNGQNRFTISDYANISNVPVINTIYYVQANNGSDIVAKVLACPLTGCKIIIPSGTYNIDSIATTSSQNKRVEIVGQGETTIINLTATSEGFFRSGGTEEGTSIRNLRIEANGLNQTILQFAAGSHTNTLIENVHILNTSHIAISHNGSFATFRGNNFENVKNGIILNSHENYVDRVVFIEGNVITNVDYDVNDNEGIDLNFHNASYSYCSLKNNYIKGFREDGMDINCQYSTILGNTVIDPDYNGINTSSILVNFAGDNPDINTVISGNIVMNSVGQGIYTSQNGTVSIMNNIVRGSPNGMGGGWGIRLTASPLVSVIGNILENLNTGISNEMGTLPEFGHFMNQYRNVTLDISGNKISKVDDQIYFTKRIDFRNELNVFGVVNSVLGYIRLDSNESTQPSLFIQGFDSSSTAYVGTSSSVNRTLKLWNIGSAELDVDVEGQLQSKQFDAFGRIQAQTGDLRVGNSTTQGTLQVYGASTYPALNLVGSDTSRIARINLGSSSDTTLLLNNTGAGNLNLILEDGFLQLKGNQTAMTCSVANAGSIYYDGTTKKHYGCNSTDWNALY